MTVWAWVQNGAVHAVESADPTGRFPSAITWVAAPAGCDVGWTYNGTTFAAPVVAAQPKQAAIRAQLADLDTSIPRGLEDMWAASGFDTTKLPAATQGKLAQKGTLRTQLAALIDAGTP
jgi:hypothetical protein